MSDSMTSRYRLNISNVIEQHLTSVELSTEHLHICILYSIELFQHKNDFCLLCYTKKLDAYMFRSNKDFIDIKRIFHLQHCNVFNEGQQPKFLLPCYTVNLKKMFSQNPVT